MTGVSDVLGEAPAAQANGGLNALDRQRAASLADEGGSSGATVESQESSTAEPRRGRSWGMAAFALGCLAAWRLSRRSR